MPYPSPGRYVYAVRHQSSTIPAGGASEWIIDWIVQAAELPADAVRLDEVIHRPGEPLCHRKERLFTASGSMLLAQETRHCPGIDADHNCKPIAASRADPPVPDYPGSWEIGSSCRVESVLHHLRQKPT